MVDFVGSGVEALQLVLCFHCRHLYVVLVFRFVNYRVAVDQERVSFEAMRMKTALVGALGEICNRNKFIVKDKKEGERSSRFER